MANKFKVINNTVNDNLVGLQFATDGGTPLFTVGNFQIDTTFSEKQNKDYDIGKASEYLTLTDIGETEPEDNILRKNKTKLVLNPDYTQPKTYSYFGSLKEYFRVNVEQIIINWPASIYVDNVINNFTGNTIQNYNYNPVTNISTFAANNSFFVNYFDIKYVSQYNSSESLDNPLRNLNVEYSKYTIFYNDIEYPINSYTGSTQPINDLVYFEVIGNPFPLTTGGSFSTTYHIKPNSVEVEKFFSSLSDLSTQLLDRYILPKYSSKFTYYKASEQGPFDIYVNQIFTWPVTDGYNLDIVSTGYTNYVTDLFQFCDYFDENDTNIMNRRLVAEAINRLNTIRRGDGSEDENEAERVSKLINIFAREFDEVKKYIDGLSYIRTLTYDKNANTPDTLVKDLAKTLGWSLLTPMSDVDLISSFIPTQSVYSGYTINYSNYDAETEFWRRLIVNTAHIWRSKGSRKAIEFLFDFIGTPEQLVSFNEHVYIAKKPINIDIFKLILNELTGFDDITPFNIDENGFPKVLPETPYNYYQLNGLWYRQTAGSDTNLNIFEGNNPHIGPYDGGKAYMDQFRCLIDTFSATSVSIFNDYVVFSNLFKNYSNGLIDDYSGLVYLNSYDLDGKPNICFTVTGTVTTDPDPQYVLGLCGCPVSVSDKALVLGVTKSNSFTPCSNNNNDNDNVSTGRTSNLLPINLCAYDAQTTQNTPPIILFSGINSYNIQQVSSECCSSNILIPNSTWIESSNGIGYCYWNNNCGQIKVIGSSNGNLIFYHTPTAATGLTTQQLGVNINECCNYFGGTLDVSTGFCSINQNNSPVIDQSSSTNETEGNNLFSEKTVFFGQISDLGTINSKGSGNSPCPTQLQITPANVVIDENTGESISQECCVSNIVGFNVSWNGSQCVTGQNSCQLTPIKDLNNNIILNSNGTISFINSNNVVQPSTLECCNAYSTPSLPLTFCGGNCYWVNPNQNCNNVDDFKVSLGVDGNDGVYLLSASTETCYFQVEFDMLVNFNCSEFLTCVGQNNILSILSAFTINATIEDASGTTSNTLQTFPAFKFNIENKPTGIYFSGQESVCTALNNQILIQLGDNCDIVTEDTFSSKWVKVKFNISNQVLNKKIKLGFQFINVPCKFNFLLDNIKIERLCIVTSEDLLNVTSCVGFDLDKIIDNKKSWEYTESPIVRSVDYLDYRDTNYIENDSRLLINTKEVELTLDAAKAIDNDVFCYMAQNECFFSATTATTDNFIFKYKDEIDDIDNVEKFKNFVLTRLIDPKSRQVIRDYPLLRYVYNKYLNLCGNNICDDLGNQYNYNSLQSFIELIGDYWIELIEQLVPSTAIWKGATRFYRNTIFDQPKYKYKNYSLLTCNPECTQIYSGSSYCLLTLTNEFLPRIINNLIADLNDPKYYESEITDCWFNLFNQNGGLISDGSNLIPPQILESISSGNNTLSSASLTINGNISGNTIFNSQLISGTTISSLTNVTINNLLNTIISGLTQNGYTATTDSSGIYITSPTNDDCGKIMDFNFCLDLSLSGVSGTTSAFNYPNTIDTPITVGGLMSDMARCTTNNSLYVLNDITNGSVTVVDCNTNTITTTINLPGGQNPQRIVYNSTNNTMYILAYTSSSNGIIFIIDCTTNTVINTILLTSTFNYGDLVYNSVNNRIYISDNFNFTISAIDCTTNTIINTTPSAPIPGFSYPTRMAYNPVNNRIYCTTIGAGVYMIDGNTNTIITPPIPILGDYITYDSINNRMYVTNLNGTIRYIDCNTNVASVATTIGSQSFAIEYCPPFNVIFVSYLNGGDLKVINASNMTPIQNFVGLTGNIYGIVYNPVNNKLYLASQELGNITVLSAPTISAVITANCQTCETLFSGTFQEIFSGTSTLVCGDNECGYVGYNDTGVEVIIEPVNIITSTGTTSSNCIEINNQTICSKIFINNINDDVIFGGKILNNRK